MNNIIGVVLYLMAGFIISWVANDIAISKGVGGPVPVLTKILIILLWPLWMLWHFIVSAIVLMGL